MRRYRSLDFMLALMVTPGIVVFSGCSSPSVGDKKTESVSVAPGGGKLPTTTASEEAKKEFVLGREKFEKLQAQDSLVHFDKAIAIDPGFASAELARANASPTTKEFFEHLNKAVALSNKSSEGERLLILAAEAGANGNVTKQKEYLDKLLAAHPNDERVNFAVGGYYFGQQEYPKAIEHYKKATQVAPDYSPAYNIVGYAHRQTGDYASAEQAFKKYIELIPNDPNPYDSYAELLLKMGKFDDSVVQYRKALSIDPNFVNSHLGISSALVYTGKTADAVAELQQITNKARSDGDRRLALFGMAVAYADAGQLDKAVEMLDAEYSVAEKINDVASMSADLQAKGTILVEAGKFDDAKKAFDQSLKITTDSNQSQEIKDNAKLVHHFNLATVALGKGDIATAKTESEEFRKGAEAKKNPAQIRQSHQLRGTIAMAEKNYDAAISELGQAGTQNPQNFYLLSQAYRAKGDKQKAREFCQKAAEFNSLPQLNYAFVRAKAAKDLAAMKV